MVGRHCARVQPGRPCAIGAGGLQRGHVAQRTRPVFGKALAPLAVALGFTPIGGPVYLAAALVLVPDIRGWLVRYLEMAAWVEPQLLAALLLLALVLLQELSAQPVLSLRALSLRAPFWLVPSLPTLPPRRAGKLIACLAVRLKMTEDSSTVSRAVVGSYRGSHLRTSSQRRPRASTLRPPR